MYCFLQFLLRDSSDKYLNFYPSNICLAAIIYQHNFTGRTITVYYKCHINQIIALKLIVMFVGS